MRILFTIALHENMTRRTPLIKLIVVALTAIFFPAQVAMATLVPAGRCVHSATLATATTRITVPDVIHMGEILMTREEVRNYFVNVFSEYSNDRIDILSNKGKGLLKIAREPLSSIDKVSFDDIAAVVTFYKNIKHKAGDEIKEQFPHQYFKLPFPIDMIIGQKIDIPLLLGCVNGCDFCPVNRGGIKQRMPYPLIVMLAKLNDAGDIRHKFGTFNYEPLYYADAVCKNNGVLSADILFADVLKLFRPGTGKTKFANEQERVDNMTWQFVTHGPLSNSKNMYYKIAQLNIERLNKVGQENDRFGMGKIESATMELSVDTSSILWREFMKQAEKKQPSPDEAEDIEEMVRECREEYSSEEEARKYAVWYTCKYEYVLMQYVEYYEALMDAFTHGNKNNKVFLRVFMPPAEMKSVTQEKRELAQDITDQLSMQRLFLSLKGPLEEIPFSRVAAKGNEFWTMEVLSQNAYDEIKHDPVACESVWDNIFSPKAIPFSNRLLQVVVQADGQIRMRVHPKLIIANKIGLTLNQVEKEIVAQTILYGCLYDKELIGIYEDLLSGATHREFTELLELINVRDSVLLEATKKAKREGVDIGANLLDATTNVSEEVMSAKLRCLVDALIAEDIPIPIWDIIEMIMPRLIATGYGPQFNYVPVFIQQDSTDDKVNIIMQAA